MVSDDFQTSLTSMKIPSFVFLYIYNNKYEKTRN